MADKISDDVPDEKGESPEQPGKAIEAYPDAAEIASEKLVPQHHVSKILDEVLEDEPPSAEAGKSRTRHLIVLDLFLAAGLLLSTAGFTIGLFKMYITHSAQQSLMSHNYRAAIEILRGNPLPPFFSMDGNDPDDLLAQALYLDAIKRIDEDSDLPGGLKELQEIRPGSRYFTLAQQILAEHFVPADTQLEGKVEEPTPVSVPVPVTGAK